MRALLAPHTSKIHGRDAGTVQYTLRLSAAVFASVCVAVTVISPAAADDGRLATQETGRACHSDVFSAADGLIIAIRSQGV